MSGLSLDATQLDRYSRHIIMDEVGSKGQQALLDARVLVIGAGGLGAPAIEYLAAAGVGTIGIADDDTVERSNLQRQVIHGDDDVGRPKVESAADFVRGLNPDIAIETHEVRVDPDNAPALIAEYDFVVDASDNFRTRYLVNDVCTLTDTPFSHGAIYKFEGQVTTFTTDGPCYRCLFPESPPGRRGRRLCDDGCPRRPPRNGRLYSGDRDGESHHGYRRTPRRPDAVLRRDGHEFRGGRVPTKP